MACRSLHHSTKGISLQPWPILSGKVGRKPSPPASLLGRPLCFDPAGGVTDQLGVILQSQFRLDAAAVGVHGLKTQIKLLGDGAAVFALADQLQNFKLPVGEPRDSRTAL